MKTLRIILLVAVGIAILVGAVYWRQSANQGTMAQFAAETKQEFMAELARTQVYQTAENAPYIDGLADAAHEAAWASAHSMSPTESPRTDVVIDSRAYGRAMLAAMIERARQDGAEHVATGLERVYAELFGLE
ncbi:MAG: hypothetical protein KDA05_05250 [Phycisphaerales bacterium]|nr:hypothetical protein [Phycisphaerales bacterium]